MKVLVNYLNQSIILIICYFILGNKVNAQTNVYVFKKKDIQIVNINIGKEYLISPYDATKLDYHKFKEEGESKFAYTKGDWYLKYKRMFDFRCKEPFLGGGPTYLKNDYPKISYQFRLVDNQIIEDSIQFLLDKYLTNNRDTIRKWNLPVNIFNLNMGELINRLGIQHFKMVIAVFDSKKNTYFIDVPEAEQSNDNMVMMRLFKYPADVDIFLYNFKLDNWEYVETVTVSGDHELELYVLQKFEPRYLDNCK